MLDAMDEVFPVSNEHMFVHEAHATRILYGPSSCVVVARRTARTGGLRCHMFGMAQVSSVCWHVAGIDNFPVQYPHLGKTRVAYFEMSMQMSS
jgi:hypothetical protein